MQRDLNLMRKILIKIADSQNEPPLYAEDFYELSDNKLNVDYQLYLLSKAGYIESEDTACLGDNHPYGKYDVYWLTPLGNDYLSAIRNDTVWKKVLSRIVSSGGDLTLDMIKELAKTILLAQIKFPLP